MALCALGFLQTDLNSALRLVALSTCALHWLQWELSEFLASFCQKKVEKLLQKDPEWRQVDVSAVSQPDSLKEDKLCMIEQESEGSLWRHCEQTQDVSETEAKFGASGQKWWGVFSFGGLWWSGNSCATRLQQKWLAVAFSVLFCQDQD